MPSAVKPYRNLGRVRPDSKGRITLGKLAEGVSSYIVRADADGRLVLEPYAEIPARERWLFENKAARGQVLRGLADSAAGRVRSLGSFARYARVKTKR
jgi:hypothetical protein